MNKFEFFFVTFKPETLHQLFDHKNIIQYVLKTVILNITPRIPRMRLVSFSRT